MTRFDSRFWRERRCPVGLPWILGGCTLRCQPVLGPVKILMLVVRPECRFEWVVPRAQVAHTAVTSLGFE